MTTGPSIGGQDDGVCSALDGVLTANGHDRLGAEIEATGAALQAGPITGGA